MRFNGKICRVFLLLMTLTRGRLQLLPSITPRPPPVTTLTFIAHPRLTCLTPLSESEGDTQHIFIQDIRLLSFSSRVCSNVAPRVSIDSVTDQQQPAEELMKRASVKREVCVGFMCECEEGSSLLIALGWVFLSGSGSSKDACCLYELSICDRTPTNLGHKMFNSKTRTTLRTGHW